MLTLQRLGFCLWLAIRHSGWPELQLRRPFQLILLGRLDSEAGILGRISSRNDNIVEDPEVRYNHGFICEAELVLHILYLTSTPVTRGGAEVVNSGFDGSSLICCYGLCA